jgi:protein phosphatase 1G
MTSQEVVDFVGARLESKSPTSICKDLFHHCLADDTLGDGTGCDNMTAIVVKFEKQKCSSKRKANEEDTFEEPQSKKSRGETFEEVPVVSKE